MAVTTILVESDQAHIQTWTDYIKEYDQEISKTAALDLTALGTPKVAASATLEAVLDLMGQVSGGVALIYAHANADGLIMRITENANSAQSKFLRGISRAWKAVDEIIHLRSGKWPAPGQPASVKPEFLIDLPAALALFKKLIEELRQLDGGLVGRLKDLSQVTNRDQADAWFDQWMDLMAKACLGRGLGETDLRRVCRAMQKVRDARFQRVEIRACNIGKNKDTLDAFKEFFGVGQVVAPKVTMFFGKTPVNLNSSGNLDQLAKQMGGFRAQQFTAPQTPNHRFNQTSGGEPAMLVGRRNRIFPDRSPAAAIMQVTEIRPFHFRNRLFSTTAASMTRFLQTHYKSNHTFKPNSTSISTAGLWTAAQGSGAQVPFILPLEASYRDFLETSS